MMLVTLLLAAAVPAYTIDFDRGFADSTGKEPTKSANVRLVDDGVRGKAVWVEEKGGQLEYDLLPGILTRTSGAISVWFKLPEDAVGGNSNFDRDCNPERTVWQRPDTSRLRRALIAAGGCGGIRSGSFTSAGWNFGHELSHVGRFHENEWHHYVVQGRNGMDECYLDGVIFWYRSWPSNLKFKPLTEKDAKVHVGSLPYVPSWGGAIDEIRLFDRALTPEEVREEYRRGRDSIVELLDYAAEVGVESKVRFRSRDLKTGRLDEYTRTVKPERPGLFRLREKGLAFELYALDPKLEKPAGRDFAEERLVYAVDCTKEPPKDGFADCGSHIATNAAGCVFRETDANSWSVGFAYRFPIPEPGKPYWIEAEYPDDARREFAIGVYPENADVVYGITLDCFGVMTGVDNPVTGRLGKKRLLFWPHTTNVAVAVLGYIPFPGSKNPACASLRLYTADLGLGREEPKGGVEVEGRASRRTVGVWDEDPTMDASLAFINFCGWPKMTGSLEFWHAKWQHVLDYMAYHHLNSWVIKTVDYSGDVCMMPATFQQTSARATCPGRVPGWDDLGAKMLDAAGHDVWARLNWRNGSGVRNWLSVLGGKTDTAGTECVFESQKNDLAKSGTGVGLPMKFYRDDVKGGIKRLIAGYRDKFGVYPHFRGITLNEHSPVSFDSIDWGYDDETIALFEKETGVKVPEKSPEKRYAYLTEARGPTSVSAEKGTSEKWLNWRCRKVAEVLRELVAELNAGPRKDLTLQFWIRFASYGANTFRDIDTYDMDRCLRGAGLDLKALGAIPGLRVVMTERPDYCRSNNTLDTNEPYLLYSDAFAKCLNDGGVSAVNVFRHSNYEVYHDVSGAAKLWKNWWCPLTTSVRGDRQLRYYAEPQAEMPYVMEPFAQLVAMCDVQDLQHGWWGGPEVGSHAASRAFYGEFVKIPRGRFDLLKGWRNDPVAIRVSSEGKGWYVVNREGYDATLTYSCRGFLGLKRTKTLKLGPCELRYFGPDEEPPLAGSVSVAIDPAARERLLDTIAKMRELAQEPARETLRKSVMPKLEAAARAEEWTKVRSLLLTSAARAARMSNVVTVLPRLDYAKRTLTISVENREKKDLCGTITLRQAPKGWNVRKNAFAFRSKAGGTGGVTFEFDAPDAPSPRSWERFEVKLTTLDGEQNLSYAFPKVACTPRSGKRETKGLSYYSTWSMNRKSQQVLKERFGRELVAYASVQYDAKGVWVEADVLDPDYVPPTEYGRFYEKADSLQLYFDVRNDGRSFGAAPGYDPDDVVFQAGELNGKGLVVREYPDVKTVEGATVKVTRRNKEWSNWVVFIPKEAVPGLVLEKGAIFGFGLQINQLMRHPAGDYEAPLSHGDQYLHPGNWVDAEVQ